jgi:hypothetical protein
MQHGDCTHSHAHAGAHAHAHAGRRADRREHHFSAWGSGEGGAWPGDADLHTTHSRAEGLIRTMRAGDDDAKADSEEPPEVQGDASGGASAGERPRGAGGSTRTSASGSGDETRTRSTTWRHSTAGGTSVGAKVSSSAHSGRKRGP